MEGCLSEEGIVLLFSCNITGAVSGLSGAGGWGTCDCGLPVFVQEGNRGDTGDCGYSGYFPGVLCQGPGLALALRAAGFDG